MNIDKKGLERRIKEYQKYHNLQGDLSIIYNVEENKIKVFLLLGYAVGYATSLDFSLCYNIEHNAVIVDFANVELYVDGFKDIAMFFDEVCYIIKDELDNAEKQYEKEERECKE